MPLFRVDSPFKFPTSNKTIIPTSPTFPKIPKIHLYPTFFPLESFPKYGIRLSFPFYNSLYYCILRFGTSLVYSIATKYML